MSHLLLLISASLALSNLVPSDLSKDNQHWLSFKATYNKSYENDRIDTLRMAVFLDNKRQIDHFNAKHSAEAGYELGLNHFADMSNLEMQSLSGFRKLTGQDVLENSVEADEFISGLLNNTVPDELDWRKEEGIVTSVKDQGQCGSDWAFAVVGALEGREKKRIGKTVDLSVQNLIDCDEDNFDCVGIFTPSAFGFIHDQGGINDDASYPYEGKKGKCRFRKDKVAISDDGWVKSYEGDEDYLKKMVANTGPVSVGIDASDPLFRSYKKGVYKNDNCKTSGSDLNRGMLIVGYGNDKQVGDFWIVKNSWGPQWGENGYIRMARNKKNQCGIATLAVAPFFNT